MPPSSIAIAWRSPNAQPRDTSRRWHRTIHASATRSADPARELGLSRADVASTRKRQESRAPHGCAKALVFPDERASPLGRPGTPPWDDAQERRSRTLLRAMEHAASSPSAGRLDRAGAGRASAHSRAIGTRAVSRVQQFRQLHAIYGLRGCDLLEQKNRVLQDFLERSRVACNCLKIVVSSVRVRVSPSEVRP
jgi:hypothetical protein